MVARWRPKFYWPKELIFGTVPVLDFFRWRGEFDEGQELRFVTQAPAGQLQDELPEWYDPQRVHVNEGGYRFEGLRHPSLARKSTTAPFSLEGR